MALKQVPPLDAAWLVLESRDTPMHVGGLFEFTLPDDAPQDYLKQELERMRATHTIPPPWNLRLVQAPLLGSKTAADARGARRRPRLPRPPFGAARTRAASASWASWSPACTATSSTCTGRCGRST